VYSEGRKTETKRRQGTFCKVQGPERDKRPRQKNFVDVSSLKTQTAKPGDEGFPRSTPKEGPKVTAMALSRRTADSKLRQGRKGFKDKEFQKRTEQ